VAKLLRTLVSTLAAAFLIASFAQGQVRQGTEPESVRHDQSESEYGAQSLIGTWKLLWARAFDDAGQELPLPFGPRPMGIAVFHASLQTRVGIATGLVVVGDLIGSGASQEQAIVGETPNPPGCCRAQQCRHCGEHSKARGKPVRA